MECARSATTTRFCSTSSCEPPSTAGLHRPKRLEAAPPCDCTNDGKLRAAMPLYRKEPFLGRIRLRLGLGAGLRAGRPELLPETGLCHTVYTGTKLDAFCWQDGKDSEAASRCCRAHYGWPKKPNARRCTCCFRRRETSQVCAKPRLKFAKTASFTGTTMATATSTTFWRRSARAKRKKSRRDRRRVTDAGITFRRLSGDDLDAVTWQIVYRLISITFLRRGSMPYFSLDFFKISRRGLPNNILVVIAEQAREADRRGGLLCRRRRALRPLLGQRRALRCAALRDLLLPGHRLLHRARIANFEPGTQGEHKISRGFTPVQTCSAHWLEHPEFFAAIGSLSRRRSAACRSLYRGGRRAQPVRR